MRTWTTDSSVFYVCTVVTSEIRRCTVSENVLRTPTLHIIQPNLTDPFSETLTDHGSVCMNEFQNM